MTTDIAAPEVTGAIRRIDNPEKNTTTYISPDHHELTVPLVDEITIGQLQATIGGYKIVNARMLKALRAIRDLTPTGEHTDIARAVIDDAYGTDGTYRVVNDDPATEADRAEATAQALAQSLDMLLRWDRIATVELSHLNGQEITRARWENSILIASMAAASTTADLVAEATGRARKAAEL